MTFEEAVAHVNDSLSFDGIPATQAPFQTKEDVDAFKALVQKVCELDAEVKSLMDRNPS